MPAGRSVGRSYIGSESRQNRTGEVWMVEKVEEFCTKSEGHLLGKRGVLEN